MDELITFLRACLDDDERVAREAAGAPWVADIPGAVHVDAAAIAEDHALRKLGFVASVERDANRQHIALWNPKRALAEIAAKREIIEEHAPDLHGYCPTCDDNTVEAPCHTVQCLALPYADRPGYREEWRP